MITNPCQRKVKLFFVGLIGIILFTLFNILYIKPVRNVLFKSFWPNSWRTVSTLDILSMRNIEYPPNVTDAVHCKKLSKPAVRYEDINQNAMNKYNEANEHNPLFQNEDYAGFLPTVSWKDRVEILQVLQVFAKALDELKVSYFFTGGSLLGVYRHGGPIPWDTDIDMAVDGSRWEEVREALSCIEGFKLRTFWHMHWKFHLKEKYFPFIDVFLFAENKQYVYAMNYYTLNSILYRQEDVWPLSEASFDGIMVPVPAEMGRCVRVEFDPEYCYPPSTNHKTGKHFKKTLVKCSDMASVYPVKNLEF